MEAKEKKCKPIKKIRRHGTRDVIKLREERPEIEKESVGRVKKVGWTKEGRQQDGMKQDCQ